MHMLCYFHACSLAAFARRSVAPLQNDEFQMWSNIWFLAPHRWQGIPIKVILEMKEQTTSVLLHAKFSPHHSRVWVWYPVNFRTWSIFTAQYWATVRFGTNTLTASTVTLLCSTTINKKMWLLRALVSATIRQMHCYLDCFHQLGLLCLLFIFS